MFQNEIIAYGLTLLMGVLSGYVGSSYLKVKKLISLLNEVIEDDRITADEVRKILQIL